MRDSLAPLLGKRITVQARVRQFGKKSGWNQPETTILLVDVKTLQGDRLTDHIWMTVGKRFERQGICEVQEIQFEATVMRYWKGYQGDGRFQELDYKLAYPANVLNRSMPEPQITLKGQTALGDF